MYAYKFPSVWTENNTNHPAEYYITLLLHLREWWRGIVMSTSVCVSDCLPGYLRNHTCDLYHFCACCLRLWHGSPKAGWRHPKGKGQFWGFVPRWQCIVMHLLQKGSLSHQYCHAPEGIIPLLPRSLLVLLRSPNFHRHRGGWLPPSQHRHRGV